MALAAGGGKAMGSNSGDIAPPCSALPLGLARFRRLHLRDMKKPVSYSAIRAVLNRVFTRAKKEARTPQEYRAIDEQEHDASNRLLNEMMHGDDDGEWIRRA